MDGEDRVEADQDSGGEEEVADFLGFLQQQISRPEEELPNAARTIRELVRSSNVLAKYYQRFQSQVAGNEIILRGSNGAIASTFQGRTRIEKPPRQRRRQGQKPRQSSTFGNDRTLMRAENYSDSVECSSKKHEVPRTTRPNDQSLSHQQITEIRCISKDYRCIYCDQRCATKGNTRKHIEEQHVSKKLQLCSGCGNISSNIPKANNHSKVCPKADKRDTITAFHEARDERKVYGSEFTGQCFISRRAYVDHLLYLSVRLAGSAPPIPSIQLKFRALLEQPAIQGEWTSVHRQWLGTTGNLSGLEWGEDEMEKAIRLLEMAIVDVEPGPTEALRRHAVRPFLEQLLFIGLIKQSDVPQPLSAGPEMPELGMNANAGSADRALFYRNDATLTSFNRAQTDAQGTGYQLDRWHSMEVDETWSEGSFDVEPHSLEYADANQPMPHLLTAIADDGRRRWNTVPATMVHDLSESQRAAPTPYQVNCSLDRSKIIGSSTVHGSTFGCPMPSFAQPPATYVNPHISYDARMPVYASSQDDLTQSASRLHVPQQPGQWQQYMQ